MKYFSVIIKRWTNFFRFFKSQMIPRGLLTITRGCNSTIRIAEYIRERTINLRAHDRTFITGVRLQGRETRTRRTHLRDRSFVREGHQQGQTLFRSFISHAHGVVITFN